MALRTGENIVVRIRIVGAKLRSQRELSRAAVETKLLATVAVMDRA